MSTKVYVAYKLKDSNDLWPWVRDTRRRGEEEVKTVLRTMYADFGKAVKTRSKKFKEGVASGKSAARMRLSLTHDLLREGYKSQLSSSQRGPFNFDVSVVIREFEGGLYILPYCDWMMRDVLDFLKKDKRLEDFAYWNNTDMPDGMTDKAWKARGRVWDALDANGWGDYLAIHIMEWTKFFQVDPYWDLVKELHTKEKANG